MCQHSVFVCGAALNASEDRRPRTSVLSFLALERDGQLTVCLLVTCY